MLAATQNDALKNHLLAALPEDEFVRVLSKLEAVSFKLGEVLFESGDKLDCVYFPTTSITSLLYIMENGATAEIGVIVGKCTSQSLNQYDHDIGLGSCSI